MTNWTQRKPKKISLDSEKPGERADGQTDFESRYSPMHSHVHTVNMSIHGRPEEFSDSVKTLIFGAHNGTGLNLVSDALTYANDQYDVQLRHQNLTRFSTITPNTIGKVDIVLVVATTPETLAQLLRQVYSAITQDQVLCVAVANPSTHNIFCTQEQIQTISAPYNVRYIELDDCSEAVVSNAPSLLTALTDKGHEQMREALAAIEKNLLHSRVPNSSPSSFLSALGSAKASDHGMSKAGITPCVRIDVASFEKSGGG